MIDVNKDITEENQKENDHDSFIIIIFEEFFFYKFPFESLSLITEKLLFVFFGIFIFSDTASFRT